jgi:hypothetical protein
LSGENTLGGENSVIVKFRVKIVFGRENIVIVKIVFGRENSVIVKKV